MTKHYLIEVDFKTLKLMYKMIDVINKKNIDLNTMDVIEVLNNAEKIEVSE